MSGSTGQRLPIRPALVLLSLVVAGVALLTILRPSTPPLVQADFERAERLWNQQDFEDYSVTVLKEEDSLGREHFVTTVRGGQTTELVLDGRPLDAKPTYSVGGLFEVIRRELEMLETSNAAGTTQQEGQPRGVVLKARFHEELGLPLVFKRFAADGNSFVLTIEEFATPGRGTLYP